MKHKQVFKTFRALAFTENGVTGENPSALGGFPPQLTTESSRTFKVHAEDSAAGTPAQPKLPGRSGAARSATRLDQPSPDAAQTGAPMQGLREAALRGEEFREKLHQRAIVPYPTAVPYLRWGINE